MILKYCLKIVKGKSPALLVALRGDKELYEQALEVYHETNYLTLPENSQIEFIYGLPTKALSRVRMLRIKCVIYFHCVENGYL